LTNARQAALERLFEGVLDGSIAVTDIPKAFQTLDQAFERNHKITAGYYLTPEQQKLLVSQWVAVINKRVQDDETKRLIGEDIAALPVPKA